MIFSCKQKYFKDRETANIGGLPSSLHHLEILKPRATTSRRVKERRTEDMAEERSERDVGIGEVGPTVFYYSGNPAGTSSTPKVNNIRGPT